MSEWKDSDKRVRQVESLVPSHWDRGPLSLVHELREMLKSVADEGTAIDTGGGDGVADLWVWVQGVEYRIQVQRSNLQKLKDAGKSP